MQGGGNAKGNGIFVLIANADIVKTGILYSTMQIRHCLIYKLRRESFIKDGSFLNLVKNIIFIIEKIERGDLI